MNPCLKDVLELLFSGLTAVGTIAATIVALCLASRESKVVLKASAYKGVTIIPGVEISKERFLTIDITNRSKIAIHIESIALKFGKSGINGMLMFPDNGFNKLPYKLEPNERHSWTMPWQDFEKIKPEEYKKDAKSKKGKTTMFINTTNSDKEFFISMSDDVEKVLNRQ